MRRTTARIALISTLTLGTAAVADPFAGHAQTAADGPLVALHQGSCRQPAAEADYQLATLEPTTGDAGGQELVGPLYEGSGGIDAGLADLLATDQPYVLAIHQSAEAFGTLLACGEVGGVIVDGNLTFAIRPLNDSGFAGVAALGETDEGAAGSVILFSDVDAFAPNDAGTERQRAGGERRSGSGQERQRTGGQATGGTAGSDDADDADDADDSGSSAGAPVIGGLDEEAPDDSAGGDDDGDDRDDRTPRARRTPRATEAAATAPAGATEIATVVATEVTGTAPAGTEPAATAPAATEPPATEVVATEPAPTAPVEIATEPAPVATEPVPVTQEPVVTDPEPTLPAAGATDPAITPEATVEGDAKGSDREGEKATLATALSPSMRPRRTWSGAGTRSSSRSAPMG